MPSLRVRVTVAAAAVDYQAKDAAQLASDLHLCVSLEALTPQDTVAQLRRLVSRRCGYHISRAAMAYLDGFMLLPDEPLLVLRDHDHIWYVPTPAAAATVGQPHPRTS